MEYTYADVIIDPNDPRVEIGMKYYRADYPKRVLHNANNDGGYFGTLESIDTENPEAPFVVKTGSAYSAWACLIRKKEPSYKERQAEWVKTNDIKVGDKVKILKGFDKFGEESNCFTMVDKMKYLIGMVGIVKDIDVGIVVSTTDDQENWWFWPYYSLEKVEEPEMKYVPFDLSKEEDRAKLRGAWVRKKEAPFLEQEIAGLSTNVQLVFLNDVVSVGVFNLLEEYEFTDGTPCGKLVEEIS